MLTQLPNELLDPIVSESLPEGFESLALTCKHLHQLCSPYISKHNRLKAEYSSVILQEDLDTYTYDPNDIALSVDLLLLIADEPLIGRYIKRANLRFDSDVEISPDSLDPSCADGPLMEMVRTSPYLKWAGLDWRVYWEAIRESYVYQDYSQHAAAFLLALLPNVVELVLPWRWRTDIPNDSTDRLMKTICEVARASSSAGHGSASLSQVAKSVPSIYFGWHGDRDSQRHLSWVSSLFSLPQVRSMECVNCMALAQDDAPLITTNFGTTLRVLRLDSSHVDLPNLVSLLSSTPQLKTFSYKHVHMDERVESESWDAFAYISAIGRLVGGHLESLSIRENWPFWKTRVYGRSVQENLTQFVTPGRVDMTKFTALKKLEMTMGLVVASIDWSSAESSPKQVRDYRKLLLPKSTFQQLRETLLTDFVPPTTEELWLHSGRDATESVWRHYGRALTEAEVVSFTQWEDQHVLALDLMFNELSNSTRTRLRMLKHIKLGYPRWGEISYRASCVTKLKKSRYRSRCARFRKEAAEIGISLDLVEDYDFEDVWFRCEDKLI